MEDDCDTGLPLRTGHGYMLMSHLLKMLNSSNELIHFCTQSNYSLLAINCLEPIIQKFKVINNL